MSVIIRLQNLPWSANALDIRQHFQGLSIPEGGVHIVGGEVGDAFIAFSTDEDARQAMLTDGGKIKEVKLKLMLSSRTEMQKVIEQARQQSVSLQNLLQMPAPPLVPPAPTAPVLAASTDSAKPPERRDSDANSNGSRDKDRKDRKERSRSRDRSRRDRERDRRRRSRSRDRSSRRSRRTPERSRERSKDRDRRRTPEKSRSTREGSDVRREKAVGEGVNGAGRPVPAVPVQPGPVWDVQPGPAVPDKASVPFVKSPLIAERPSMDAGRLDMDGRRIMGSGPAFGRAASNDAMQGPFQRDGWNGRPNPERFPGPSERFGGGPRPVFNSEGNDFDGRDDFMPRGGNANFRGGFRPNGDTRRPFMPTGRLGTGPGTILGLPGTMHSFPRSPAPGERFDAPFPGRPFVDDRFKRSFEPPRQPGLCVEIRNMPLDCGYSEIRKFFHGIFLANNSIKMISDNKGHRVGMAYVKLGNPEAKEQAMTLTGNTIRGSIVEVVHLEDGIFDKAIDWYKPGGPRSDTVEKQPEPIKEDEHLTCLFLEDLPTYVKEADVHRIFPDFTITDLILMPTNDDRKLFVCYANFERPEVAKSALHSRKRFVIGHMSLRVSLCSLDQFQQAVKAVKESIVSPRKDIRNQPEPEPVNIPVGPRSDCILLEGLPYQTNDRDILDFFSDVALVPLRIHIMLDNFNKPSGDAYCEFVSFEETLRAASKHNTMLGKQEISVRPVARAEMLEALGLAQPDLGPPPNPMHGGPRPFGRNFGGGGRPMGILGNGPGPRMPLNMMGRMGHGMMRPMGGQIPNDMPIEGFGKPGCVVALENIPFRAEIEEIVDIFEGFNVTRENVIRRFSEIGLATGDARVSLSSPAEAQRAVYELRGVTIRGRPIFLSLL